MNQLQLPVAFGQATLDNCEREPIHIPGSIQPHGALLAFQADRLVSWSDNLQSMLGCVGRSGASLAQLGLPPDVTDAISEVLADAQGNEGAACAAEIDIGSIAYTLIAHCHLGRSIIEFERREMPAAQVSGFALSAHRAIERVKRAADLAHLLDRLVIEVRSLTGFDRVMAYRFRHDHSGDVVAEAKSDSLGSYLNMRYPASDIPAQARRLYTLNTLRMIADMGYQPVPIAGNNTNAPLDLTYSVLRSVSPIHVEYLRNMGVGASMSVSIVVNGQLWGLIACHHMGPRHVPYSIRMSCDVLAQVVSSSVQALEAREQARLQEHASGVMAAVITDMTHAEDMFAALTARAPQLMQVLDAQALVVSQHSKLMVHGDDLSQAQAAAIISALPAGQSTGVVAYDQLSDWPQQSRDQIAPWVGALLLPFDVHSGGRIVALRREQIETVRWGGAPDKNVVAGPLGPRLTPRGSFTEWRETVRGRSEPWHATTMRHGRQILDELQRVCVARHAETELARRNLLAMLGHDLRDPLQTIRMVAGVMKSDDSDPRLGRRLESSSGRMMRLITQVLDFSRAEAGLPFGVVLEDTDLAPLVDDLVDEVRIGHPGLTIELQIERPTRARVDQSRFAQVVSNLLGNARHHGTLGAPLLVELSSDPQGARFTVRNMAPPIDPAIAGELFSPFKRQTEGSIRNRSGLGLGLYIAARIMAEHGGTLSYRYEAPQVVFEVRLPAG